MIAGGFGILLGISGILVGIFQLRNLGALDAWKTVSGKVVERGTFRITHATRSAPAFQFAPLVKYVYQVDGKEFTSDAVLPKHLRFPEHNTIEWATARAASFADEPTVFYNPEYPSSSFLVRPSKTVFYMVIGISFLAVLSGLILLQTK